MHNKEISIIDCNNRQNPFNIKEILKFKELMYVMTWRDIKVRYKQTVIGAGWAVFQPVINMVIFSILFGKIAKIPSDGIPYPVFVYSGLLPWMFFSSSLSSLSSCLLGERYLISRVYFPRIIIPLSVFGAKAIDFVISLTIMILLMVYYNMEFKIYLIFLPFLLLLTFLAAFGIGIIFAALCVQYRDINYITPFFIQIFMYITPVIYPVSIINTDYQWILWLNPMSGIIDAFRSIFFNKSINFIGLIISILFIMVYTTIGLVYFKKVERYFADII